jgi:hypothetical protein
MHGVSPGGHREHMLALPWVVWWSPERKLCTNLVGADSNDATVSSSSLEALTMWSFFHTLVVGLGYPGEIPSSGYLGGRWRRLRRDLHRGVILEALLSFCLCFSPRRVGGCQGSAPSR